MPEVLSYFSKKYPRVKLVLQHGNPSQIVQALTSGTATIGVTPYTDTTAHDIAFLECRTNRRIVLAPKKHPLTQRKQCSIEELAKYPLVAFESSISAWQSVLGVFEAAGIKPNIILSAIDADVVKDCVERGLGLTALTEVAYNPKRDHGLVVLKTANLFPPSITSVAIHRKRHIPHYAFEFIEMFAPRWSRAKVEKQLTTRS